MKRSLVAVVAVAMTVGLAGCDAAGDAADVSTDAAALEAAAAPADPAPAVDANTATPSATPAAPGAPVFAVLYPGGAVQDPAVTADGAAGPGGLVTFTTDAEPEAVVAFYRRRAEAAGLASVMSMNQGDARAYGAAAEATGAELQIVASPGDQGLTSVQLGWSAGQ